MPGMVVGLIVILCVFVLLFVCFVCLCVHVRVQSLGMDLLPPSPTMKINTPRTPDQKMTRLLDLSLLTHDGKDGNVVQPLAVVVSSGGGETHY